MKKLVFILFVSLLVCLAAKSQTIINPKGTRVGLDTSKWKLSGADIYSKNTGNTGIGITVPLYKLDVSDAANPLRLTGLQAGTATDSVLTVQNGVVRYVSISRLVTDTSIYKYDGTLTGNRTLTQGSNTLTFATGGSALNISGLTSGALTDSILSINPSTNRVNRIPVSLLNKTDSTTASNGLGLTGKDVRLGGNLTQATTVTNNSNTLTFATGGSALNISGLTSGALTDSILTINPSTNRVNRIPVSLLNKIDSTTASNGLTLVGNDAQLGGTLSKKDTIVTSATNTLALKGLQTGAITDSLLAVETSTGVIKKIAQFSVVTVKTSTTQANSTVTGATINTLSFTTVAGNSYRVRLWLVYNAAATTTGISLGPNAFSGGNYWYNTLVSTSATVPQFITGYNAVNMLVSTSSRATTANVATIEMTVEATSSATVSFQFASEVAGSAITIQSNSRLEYEIID